MGNQEKNKKSQKRIMGAPVEEKDQGNKGGRENGEAGKGQCTQLPVTHTKIRVNPVCISPTLALHQPLTIAWGTVGTMGACPDPIYCRGHSTPS